MWDIVFVHKNIIPPCCANFLWHNHVNNSWNGSDSVWEKVHCLFANIIYDYDVLNRQLVILVADCSLECFWISATHLKCDEFFRVFGRLCMLECLIFARYRWYGATSWPWWIRNFCSRQSFSKTVTEHIGYTIVCGRWQIRFVASPTRICPNNDHLSNNDCQSTTDKRLGVPLVDPMVSV